MDTPQNLEEKIQKYTQTLFQYHGANGNIAKKIREVAGVVTVEVKEATFPGAQALVVHSEKDDAVLRELSAFIQNHGGPLMEVRRIHLTLEEVFLELVTEEEQK